MRVAEAKAAIDQNQEDMKHAGIVVSTFTDPKKTFEDMMFPIWESLHDLASSDDGEDQGGNDDEETEQVKLR